MMILGLLLIAAPVPLDLVWNVSPSPHSTYVACGGNAAACVTPGEWLGICRAQQFGAAVKTLKVGNLTLDDGEAHFSGCEHYQALIAKSVKLGGDPTKAVFAEPGCQSSLDKATVGLAPFAGKTIAYRANPDGTLQFAELAQPVAKCDAIAAIVWSPAVTVTWDGPDLPLAREWDVDVVGDLNQDGAVELILSKKSTRSAMDYGALLVTLRGNAFERLAMTVTTPKVSLSPEAKTVLAVEDARDACDHWRGEGGEGDAKRAALVARNANKTCAAFKAKLVAAQKKYPSNAVLKAMTGD